MKKTWFACLKNNGWAALVCAALLFLVSCDDDIALDNLAGLNKVVPAYVGHKVVSGNQVDFYFSTDVKVLAAELQPQIDLQKSASGKTVSINMVQDHSGGKQFTADLLVEDAGGNTLNVLVPFRTRNNNMPDIHINEIRFDYSGSAGRAEFIEFRTLTKGNLGALRLYIVSADAEQPVYEFPQVAVAADEYILLHLRTLEGDTAIDETGDNRNLAKTAHKDDSTETSRDFWITDNKKIIHKTDIIYLLDQDDTVIDCVLVAENEQAWQKNGAFAKTAQFIAEQGKWKNKNGDPVSTLDAEDAVSSAGTTVTKTLNRVEGAQNRYAIDWYVPAATSSNTPGKPNKKL